MTDSSSRPPHGQPVRANKRIAAAALLLNGGAAVASFASTTILARTGGAAVVGHYALAMLTLNMLAALALLGQDRIIIRNIAGDLRQGLRQKAHGALLRSRRIIGWSAAIISLLYLFGIFYFPLLTGLDSDPSAMLLAGYGVFVVVMLRLGVAAMRGSGRQLGGQALDTLATFGFCVILSGFLLSRTSPTSAQAVLLFVGLQATAAAIAWYVMTRDMARWGPPVTDYTQSPVKAGIPLMLVIFVHLAAEWLLISTIARHDDASSVGAFRVAIQIVSIVALVVATAETYYSPLFAGDFRSERPDLAWKRHRRVNRTIIAMTAPLLLLMALFAETLLGRIFGPEFIAAVPALRILAIGQLVNVLTGPIGGMLVMSGHERGLLVLAVCGLVAVLTIGSVLVPLIGLEGAAIAWAVNILIRSGGAYVMARRFIPGTVR